MNTPEHYELDPEPIDVIEAWDMNFTLGNVIKYVARAGKKDPCPIADLMKAKDYLEREIETQIRKWEKETE